MTQDELKNEVAKTALKYITPETIIGVGTGSTANFFIDHLTTIKTLLKVQLQALLILQIDLKKMVYELSTLMMLMRFQFILMVQMSQIIISISLRVEGVH